MAVNDLAGGGVIGTLSPEQLYAGEAPIITGSAVALEDDILKYEVLILTATGLRRPDLTGVAPSASGTVDEGNVTVELDMGTPADTGAKAVIAAQPAAIGDNVPYFSGGYFNHALLVWPEALDTFEKRRAFFQGSDIHIGHIDAM